MNFYLFQVSFEGRVDLLADIPRGVNVPFVSDLTSMIPIWNRSFEDYVEKIFFLVKHFLTKKRGIILLYPYDFLMQKEIASFVDAYEFHKAIMDCD